MDPLGESGEIEVTAGGGKHSKLPVRFDLVPANALAVVARIIKEGSAKYGDTNWRAISVEEHLNHALRHAYCGLEIRRELTREEEAEVIEELGSVACRALFALEMAILDPTLKPCDSAEQST